MRVTVAVIDSGWDRGREEPRVLPGAGFLADGRCSPDDRDLLGHGSACAAEVLRWAADARVLPLRVFGAERAATPEALAAAIRWATTRHAPLILLSLGTRRAAARSVIEPACVEALASGRLLVAAGPNAGPPTYPAALPGVIAVWPDARLRPGELARRGPLELYGSPGERAGVPGGTSLAAAEVAGRVAELLRRGASADPVRLCDALTGSVRAV